MSYVPLGSEAGSEVAAQGRRARVRYFSGTVKSVKAQSHAAVLTCRPVLCLFTSHPFVIPRLECFVPHQPLKIARLYMVLVQEHTDPRRCRLVRSVPTH